jgi:hypothetical protein
MVLLLLLALLLLLLFASPLTECASGDAGV